MTETKEQQTQTKTLKKDFASFSPRERILAASLKLFVEQGYFNTNIPDLSRESKCSVGSIYHTFKNKEEIARELYKEAMHAFRSALQEAIPDDAEISVVIKKTVKSFLRFSEVNHQLSKYIWLCRHNEFMSGIIKHPAMVGFDGLGRKLTKHIKRGIRNGTIRPLKAHIIWSVLFGIPVGYVREWLDGYNIEAPSSVADDLAEICWHALK
ncbi:MAG: TetR/AcrR family transcriptional regulator, partial [SAR324 cluster bacterium]|nr:TetR/AcrR family transcriptional regulator [SAR324 cluster bacterium]